MIGVFDYTVVLTYMSMMSAMFGIIITTQGEGHPFIGMFCLLVSGFCDAFDGKVARTKANRSNLEKEFGVQIDSLADLLAFGVLPACLGIEMLRKSVRYTDVIVRSEISGKLEWYPIILKAIALLYVLAALVRLAYFNSTEEGRAKEKEIYGSECYTGLPVTAAALVMPMILIIDYFTKVDLSMLYFAMLLVLAILFVTRFKLRKPSTKVVLIMIGIGAVEFGLLAIRFFHR